MAKAEAKVTREKLIKLLNEALQGEGKTVKLDFCRTEKSKLQVYLQLELTNTMISGFSTSSGGDRPSEGRRERLLLRRQRELGPVQRLQNQLCERHQRVRDLLLQRHERRVVRLRSLQPVVDRSACRDRSNPVSI